VLAGAPAKSMSAATPSATFIGADCCCCCGGWGSTSIWRRMGRGMQEGRVEKAEAGGRGWFETSRGAESGQASEGVAAKRTEVSQTAVWLAGWMDGWGGRGVDGRVDDDATDALRGGGGLDARGRGGDGFSRGGGERARLSRPIAFKAGRPPGRGAPSGV